MKYIFILSLLFVVTTTNASSTSDTTKVQVETLQNSDYAILLKIAKDNITNATTVESQLNTYKWFTKLAPKYWRDLFIAWVKINHPKLLN